VAALRPRALALLGSLLLSACALPHWPVRGPLSSPYGLRLVGWSPEVHRGVDIAVPDGTPVAAMSAGQVVFAGTMSGYGNVVVLRHHGSTRTLYGHLSEVRVRVGDAVRGGQIIGLSGHSGNARGPHLHFEIQRWGQAEDPVPLLGGAPPHP
jgi:murein DD-endopeptidase MepM/ murein hydrolase activator NlpD